MCLAVAVLVCATAPVVAGSRSEPVENCTHQGWGFLAFQNYRFGTVNACPYAVHVWFMLPNGNVTDAVVAPGAYFDSGATEDQMSDRDWSAATCREPLLPVPAVTSANADVILRGRYSCAAQ
jgi:hypothetical protein